VRIGQALDDRCKLDKLDLLLSEETIYIKWSLRRITATQASTLYSTYVLQKPQSPNHQVEGSVTFAVPAIPVMDFLWAIEADPDHELCFLRN